MMKGGLCVRVCNVFMYTNACVFGCIYIFTCLSLWTDLNKESPLASDDMKPSNWTVRLSLDISRKRWIRYLGVSDIIPNKNLTVKRHLHHLQRTLLIVITGPFKTTPISTLENLWYVLMIWRSFWMKIGEFSDYLRNNLNGRIFFSEKYLII